MSKLFRIILIAYLVTSPVLILFLIYKTAFLTTQIYELQNRLMEKNVVERFPLEAIDTEGIPRIGLLNAPVKIYWYADVDCHACEESFQNIIEVSEAFSEDVVVFFKLLPSEKKADQLVNQLLFHAWDEGDFIDLATLLFSDSSFREPSSLKNLKNALLLSSNESAKHEEYDIVLAQNLKEFQELGTFSTPTFVVNGTVWSGSGKAKLVKEVQTALADK